VEDHGKVLSLAEGVCRIEHPVVRAEAAVDGVQLQPDGSQRDLPLQLVHERVVKVRVEVCHEAEAGGVVGENRNQVLDGLYAGRLRTVLAEQYGHVHALAVHKFVEALRDDRSTLVVELEQGGRPVAGRPAPPRLR
jgi:hypothetical protein